MKTRKIKAQSLVEFAILLPVFILVVLGIFDLGRIVYTFSALHNAAREGARYGAVNHCDVTGIEATAKNYAVGLGENVVVTTSIIYDESGAPNRISVITEYQFRTVTPLVGVFLGEGGSFPLTSQSIQHIEQPIPCN
jgi:hypothetical protein